MEEHDIIVSYQKTIPNKDQTLEKHTRLVRREEERKQLSALAPGALLGPSVIPFHKIRRAELGQGKKYHEIKSYAQENAHGRIFKNL